MEAATLIRRARTEAGLTQGQLARRLGVTQAALARLEKSGANPTIATLDRVLRATGRRLDLRLARPPRSVDPTLLREALAMTPAARIAAAERLLADAESIAAAGARGRARG
jgi:transcriptional regulator with XRE-family HTH domain